MSIIEATCGRLKSTNISQPIMFCNVGKKNKSLNKDVKIFETLREISFCQSEHWTVHSPHQTQLETPLPHPSPTRKKREALLLHDTTSCWLHGNSIPKIGCHYFLPGQIALSKSSLPILLLICFILISWGCFTSPTFFLGQ